LIKLVKQTDKLLEFELHSSLQSSEYASAVIAFLAICHAISLRHPNSFCITIFWFLDFTLHVMSWSGC